MASVMQQVVLPALSELDITPDVHGDEARLITGSSVGLYEVYVKELISPPVLWLRCRPHLYVDSLEPEFLSALLELNERGLICKIGRDATNGEVVFDSEILLSSYTLTKGQFHDYLYMLCKSVEDALPLLARVRHGGLSVTEAIKEREEGTHSSSVNRRTRQPKTKVEREAEAIIKDLGGDKDQ